jgi:hypothetical protein
VTLLAVMWAAMMLLYEEMMRRWGLTGTPAAAAAPEWAMFLLGMGVMSLLIVWHLLFLGFVKTAAMDGEAPCEPVQLLMAGRPYLWRIIGFQFLVGIALWAVTYLLLMFYFAASGQTDGAKPAAWLLEVVGTSAVVLMIKPVFLVPAFVVVLDMNLAEAIVRMFAVPLREIRTLVKMVVIGFAATTSIGIAASLVPEGGALFYAASGVNYLAKSVNLLVLWTATAVWTAGVFLPLPPPSGDDTDE